MSRKATSIRMRDKIFKVFQAESGPPPLEPNATARAEQDGFQRFMQEYAVQQGTAPHGIRGESTDLQIQAASPRRKRGM